MTATSGPSPISRVKSRVPPATTLAAIMRVRLAEERLVGGMDREAIRDGHAALRDLEQVLAAHRQLPAQKLGDERAPAAAEALGHVRERGVGLGGVAAGARHLVERQVDLEVAVA